ncbi:aspartate--tRNA ligase [Caproiciproducens galactitolivorans]|uniref:Aspartate--tRNA(Asp/Asn) ligase n=1 Tax=Caproiciproducens galactitolivorans TaxID=642589 RepID=A0A4Z0XWM6_9FIRM|nr:aspartate--tRNA ligase [Caproiciproducens galactitolivorans]QEY35812.1 aspartate--tRNA ligase [Caproiciproducens galactitolivorans]TGJ75764.1 aspartate--tRNA ligase [Caproiciproducens galactitolivorans]
MICVNQYRTHLCGEISENDIGREVRVAGWVENIRDHGGVKFVDLRDHYGIVQIVIYDNNLLNNVTKESTVSAAGKVVLRDQDTINPKIKTGTVEVKVTSLTVLGKSLSNLPFEVEMSKETKEDLRLKYRFLDLRNPKVHKNIVLRSQILSFLRNKMTELGFLEIQTPILSASSPEGARDYLIPSRKHPGKFYALPQAPQIFKQLLMVSGFDRYFQIAPCFRDEDARADRSPGEFYQLDFEMAFATQEDVFSVAEEVLSETFSKFSDKTVSKAPFPRIPFQEAMLKYGTDKPDLRNPLEIIDISDLFENTDFAPFKGKTVRAINVPDCVSQPKSFFENMLKFATDIGMKGLGYISVTGENEYKGPINKYLSEEDRAELIRRAGLKPGCVIFFIADDRENAPKFAGQIRTQLGERLNRIDKDSYQMCFIVDFPMYEIDEETGNYVFTHNPFSMPQGGMDALLNKKPEDILAYQYDIVCNGVELSSGAVRNHDLEIMVKAFEIAGYTEEDIKNKFTSLYHAFQYGAPPHAGMAPGVDRMIMLLTGEENIREVIAFPMNSNAQDVLMGAPNEVTERQLREVHIRLRK